MVKITTPISTNQMTRFIQHTKEWYITDLMVFCISGVLLAMGS